jgi:hypothetical protein
MPQRHSNMSPAHLLLTLMADKKVRKFYEVVQQTGVEVVEKLLSFENELNTAIEKNAKSGKPLVISED